MIEKVIKEMITYYGDDIRRINHAMKVYGFASTIARNEDLDEDTVQIIDMAAILHDIGIPEAERIHNSSAGKYQEIEGPPIARKMLVDLGVKEEIIERACYLIGNHHSYSKIDGIDFQILVEADFLVNIYEDKMDNKLLPGIRGKYFKTSSGQMIFDTVY